MSPEPRDILAVPAGFRAREAAITFAQWDDKSHWLREDTRGLEPAELEWQPAPGMNTIGMLLAHIAIVEVFWTQLGPLGRKDPDCLEVLGIGMDDDGIPIPEGGRPPATLRGKDLAFYDDLLARARAYSRAALEKLEDVDFDRIERRTRRNGEVEEFNVRWVVYHMLEHYAGHHGQILLLRHQYRLAQARSGATASP